MKNNIIFNVTFSGVMIALGLVLPFLTGQIPEIGSMLCPMHIPVLICGLLCGWKYGTILGMIIPILRSLLFSMPPLYPTAISMSFELLTYGLVSGICFEMLKRKNVKFILCIYISLIVSMIMGRAIWGIARYMLSIVDESNIFNIEIFLTSAFVTAWPGIVIQLTLIPLIMFSLNKIRFLKD